MILLVSSERDGHARAVLDRLAQEEVDAQLLDLSEFPQRLQVSLNYDGHGDYDHRLGDASGSDLTLAECNVVWWRRPQPFELHSQLGDPVDYNFAYTECQAAFDGLWLTLDAFWVNQPTRDEVAGRKVHQLKLAGELGFETPATCITNRPEEARTFVETYGPGETVYKPFSGTEQAWRETRVLDSDELDLLDTVQFAPVIFQEYIPADVDLRITVIGDHIFPAAIHSQETEYTVDFRMAMDDARVEAVELPDEVTELIHEFMEQLGLVYGAIDMRLTPDGRYVFLEINPSGQWLFIEQRTGLPLTETFVELLVSHDRDG